MANTNVQIVEETCCREGCGVIFWIVQEYHDRLVSTKRLFYCPNGHAMNYTGESDQTKIIRLKNEKIQMERMHAIEIARIKHEYAAKKRKPRASKEK